MTANEEKAWEMIRELVEAATILLIDWGWAINDKSEDRLDAALQHFREEVMPHVP